ncbi:hypothetical protein EV126DRAFT_439876 [Verticillium dahliae]|nr:hypothetical protein EV126DRAFT_439876 [Verticillium dahliae]
MVGYWGGGTLLLGQSVSPLPPSARNDKDRILPEVEPGAHSNTTNTTAQGALSSDYFVDLASGGAGQGNQPEDGPPGTKFDRYPSAFPIDIFPSPRTDNPGSGSDKKTRLRARNRAAADMYRARKQRGIEDLQAQEAALSAINESLRDKYVKLRGEVLMLRDMVLQHRRCRCSFIEKYGVVGDRVDKTVRPIGGYFGSNDGVARAARHAGGRVHHYMACAVAHDSGPERAQLLSLAFLGHGKDHFVLIYLAEASRMATRMCLFGVEPAVALSKTNEIPQDMRSASCYAAWGIFNWTILTSLFYQQPGLEYPEYPPVLPIPVRSNQTSPLRNFSEVSTTQDHETHTLWYMGETFAYLCKFWQILHGVTIVYHKRNQEPFRPVNEHVSVDFAERKYRELLALADTLPSSLIHSGDSPHHVLIFHLWFHAAILDIFRPFIQHPVARQSRVTTFSSSESSPEAAFRASLTQLKRLIVVYRSKYQSSEHTILWHTALIYVANAVLQDTRDPEWHFYFLQCVSGYESLRKSYRLAEVVGRALLSMTLRNGDISGTEARELLQRLKQKGLDHDTSDRIRATFMGDLELAMTNPRQASVENLAEQFEDMALWQEFTNTEGV